MIDMKGIGHFTPFVITLNEDDETTRQPEVKNCAPGYRFLYALSQGIDFSTTRRTIQLSAIHNIIAIEPIGNAKILIIAQTEEEFNTNDLPEGVTIAEPMREALREPQPQREPQMRGHQVELEDSQMTPFSGDDPL